MASYQTLVNASALTFDDEFNSFVSSPNGSVGWMTSYQYAGEAARNLASNDEEQYYSDSSVGTNPFTDSNGILGITASVAVAGSNPYGLPYTSGLITTYRSFAQLYGYFEISAELPAGQGLWPTFFLLPANGGDATELDVFEDLGGTPDTIHLTAHFGSNNQTSTTFTVPTATTAFNTYGVDWEPTTITFYIDGVAVASMPTPATMDTPMYMLADLAVGGPSYWGGPPTSNAIFPATLQINDVRVYATANTVDVSGTAAIETASVSGQVLLAGLGRSGVVVSLLNAAGTVVATMTTGVSGAYSFSALAAGTYQVAFTPPTGFALLSGSEANATTGLTPVFTLTDGAALNLPVEALQPPANPATIQSSVLYLTGSASAPDSGLTVSLYSGSGTLIATTVTNSSGNFSFTNLVAGSYEVAYTLPSGLVFSAGGEANDSTGMTPVLTVTAGQDLTLPSELLLSNPSTITAFALHFDAPTDPHYGTKVSGVTVSLLNQSGAVIATQVSTTWAGVSFGQIAPGTYELDYTPPAGEAIDPGGPENTATGVTAPFTVTAGETFTAPDGWLVTLSSISGTVMSGSADEAGIAVSLLGSSGNVVASTTTNGSGAFSFTGLAAGSYQVKYVAPAGLVLEAGGPANATTGLTAAIALTYSQTLVLSAEQVIATEATVQSSVLYFSSPTASGTADAGVTVSLLNAAGSVIATTVSASNGTFAFGDLAAGTYQLKYAAPAAQTIEPGGNANATTGLTAQFAVAAGQTVMAPSGAMVPLASIDGTVQLLSGAGEAGVTVSVLTTSGTVIATTTTNSAGAFAFTDLLAAGSYQVKYAAPSGFFLATGSEANLTTGLSPVVTLTTSQVAALPAELLLSSPGTITAAALHYGATTDNSWGTGIGGVTVSLLNAAGTVIATAVSNSSGKFSFGQIGPGTYQLKYAAPSGDGFLPTGPDTATGLTAQFTVAAGQAVNAPNGDLISTIVMNGTGLTEVAPAGAYLVSGNASSSKLTLGNGNQFVTLTGGGDTVTTGTGSQTISLAGNNNTVSVGTGNNTITLTGTGNTVTDTGGSGTSTFNAGSGNDTVHVTGGTDNITINATGSGNLFDAGPGLNFLNADGSAGNTFMLNAATMPSMSLTTITGFNTAGDILDLKRTLVGTDILPNLSNVGSLVTSAFSGANTMLYAAPTGGGSPVAFAALNGVHVTVAQLLAAHDFSLS